MKNKALLRFSFLLFCGIFVCLSLVQYINTTLPIVANAFDTSAKAMSVIEVESGRFLTSKNGDEKLKMASTTKIATAITVIDNCPNLDESFTIDARAVGIEGTSIYLQKGEVLTARQLLYGLMLRSGNDTSVALALHISKDIPEFCKLMNETASRAGANSTNFENPHGLDSPNHYTTACDLAKITAYAMKNQIFKEIVSTKNVKIPHPEFTHRYLSNKNRLLNSLDGCVGVKTGYTKGAGRCLVSAVERNNMTLVCVVLNCGPMFEESAEILEYGFCHYQNVELMPSYNYVRSIEVEDGKKSKLKVYCPKGFCYPLSETEQTQINIEYTLPNSVQAPIKAEEKIGTVKIYYNTTLLFESDILAMESVESEKVLEQIKDIIEKW